MSIPFGVYIGKDIEIVMTGKYIMAFRRSEKGQFLESSLLYSSTKSCIGICRTDPCCTEMRTPPETWKYAFNANNPILSDDKMKIFLDVQIFELSLTSIGLEVKYNDGEIFIAQQDEVFNMEDISPSCFSATENNIGECLQTWNMGVNDIIWNNSFVGVTINTSKHMYIFEITQNSIYCRAARYITCEHGVVFNQNFRQGLEAYMIADNRKANDKLEYDKSLFNAESCIWNDRSVYWSVSSVSDDLIILHGCQGDTYEWKKPDR
jgi:hypothetical protein